MTPRPSRDNMIYTAFRKAEHCGNSLLCDAFISQLPNVYHLSFSKFCTRMALSASLASFVDHILHILKRRAEKKVFRITADWIIAFVKYTKTFRNGFTDEFPEKSISANEFFHAITPNYSVTAFLLPCPSPTSIRTIGGIDFSPNSFGEMGFTKLISTFNRAKLSISNNSCAKVHRLFTMSAKFYDYLSVVFARVIVATPTAKLSDSAWFMMKHLSTMFTNTDHHISPKKVTPSAPAVSYLGKRLFGLWGWYKRAAVAANFPRYVYCSILLASCQ